MVNVRIEDLTVLAGAIADSDIIEIERPASSFTRKVTKINFVTDIDDADIAAGAGIAQSKLAAITLGDLPNLPTLGTLPASPRQLNIVDSEIDAAAAIALSKIADPAFLLGDLIKHDGSTYVRFAKGTGLQQIRVNAGGTDLEYFSPAAGGTGSYRLARLEGALISTDREALNWLDSSEIDFSIVDDGASDETEISASIVAASISLTTKVTGLLPNGNLANLPLLGTLPASPRQVAITNAELNNLPVLGTPPASPRQLAIVDSEISTVGLSKILGDVALGDIIKRNGSDWARLARGAVGQFFRATATDTAYQAIEFTKGGTVIDSPTAAVNIIVWRAPFACTVTNVRGYVVGGASSTINARRNGSSNHLASALTVTPVDTWVDGGAVSNTAYVAGDKLEIMIVTVVNTPTQIAIQVDFTRP